MEQKKKTKNLKMKWKAKSSRIIVTIQYYKILHMNYVTGERKAGKTAQRFSSFLLLFIEIWIMHIDQHSLKLQCKYARVSAIAKLLLSS